MEKENKMNYSKMDRLLKWCLSVLGIGFAAFGMWAMMTHNKYQMIGFTGGMVIYTLYSNVGTKKWAEWSEIDKMVLVVFGLTTLLIPFIP